MSFDAGQAKVHEPAAFSWVKVCAVGGLVPGPWLISLFHTGFTDAHQAVTTAGKAAAHAAAVAKLVGNPAAVFAAVAAARAPLAWLFSCARVAAAPAADLVQVAVLMTPSFLRTE
ncbi:MAG: hypothetical protein M3066_06085 [Actinomycetota bacterium]|nr:hypothetical protein [Actinomycetota bacterium]